MDARPDLAQQYRAAMALQRVRDEGIECSGCGAKIRVEDIQQDSVRCEQCGAHEALTDHVDGFTLEARRAYDTRVEEMEADQASRGRTDTIVMAVVVVVLVTGAIAAFVFGS
jgi:hypothetical protein